MSNMKYTGPITDSRDKQSESNANLVHAIQFALDEFRDKECGCDGEYEDGRLRGYACYFHRVEQTLRDALATGASESGGDHE